MPAPDAPALRTPFLICAALITLAFGLGWLIAGPIKENGAFELATVVTLALVAATFVLRLPSLAFGAKWHLPMLAVLLALRELDFDKRFMETGILKLRLYTGDGPLLPKLIGGVVVILVLVCLWRVLRRDGPIWFAALRRREGWAIALPLGVLGVVIAKSVDGLGRKLEPFGIALSDAQDVFAVTAEEGLEFGFALALLLSLFLWIRRYA
ncbi:hypothetical protein [Jannaschia marina]|uniref:hypothetical protein n=1 Tax=Jannaschia marina TaxID=2741674 RepID=UPI0015C89B60|nr:hypothetical protein [Jannaschia marina]